MLNSPRLHYLVPLLVICIFPVSACDGGGGTQPQDLDVAAVIVTPAAHTFMSLGETLQFSAIALDPEDNEIAGRAFTWSSSDTDIATVSSTGAVTAAANGSADITAATGGISGTAAIEVVTNQISVSPDGGLGTAANGRVSLSFPPGAVNEPIIVTVDRATSAPSSSRLIPGTAFQFGPDGTLFNLPVQLSISFDPESIPVGVPEGALRLFHATQDAWVLVGGSDVNLGMNAVIGSIEGFSVYAALAAGASGEIAFIGSRVNEDLEIYTVESDGTGIVNLTNHPAEDYCASWSPDGSKLVFSSDRDDSAGEIYVMSADGSDVTRITNDDYVDFGPAWSPDGSRIAFMSIRGPGGFDIVVMNADGSNQINLTNSEPMTESTPSWSPDGALIVYAAGGDEVGPNAIFLISSDGGEPVRLTGHVGSSDPAWSPDGAKIAYHRLTPDYGTDIYVIDADGSNETRITSDPRYERSPHWSPDGSQIVFIKSIEFYCGSCIVHTMNADGSSVIQVTEDPLRAACARWRP